MNEKKLPPREMLGEELKQKQAIYIKVRSDYRKEWTSLRKLGKEHGYSYAFINEIILGKESKLKWVRDMGGERIVKGEDVAIGKVPVEVVSPIGTGDTITPAVIGVIIELIESTEVPQLFHKGDSGELVVSNRGSIVIGTLKEEMQKGGWNFLTIDTSDLKVCKVAVEDELLVIEQSPELRKDLINKGIDVVIFNTQGIAIDPVSFAKKAGISIHPDTASAAFNVITKVPAKPKRDVLKELLATRKDKSEENGDSERRGLPIHIAKEIFERNNAPVIAESN